MSAPASLHAVVNRGSQGLLAGPPVWDSGFLNGQILSSMAAYKGRLYVLSAGIDENGPSLYCFR